MAGEDMIMARQGELKRLHVIQKVPERVIKQVEAAEILSLSSRQIRRIIKRIRLEGERGIAICLRGSDQVNLLILLAKVEKERAELGLRMVVLGLKLLWLGILRPKNPK